jgi:hypothetical protein
MRLYKVTGPHGGEVDLDDAATYEDLPKTCDELTTRMWKEIGYALSYMDFIHRDSFPLDNKQRIRVTALVARFWREGHEEAADNALNCSNVRWLQEQIFVFEDEIENMC